jgi:energy-coupling factor transporter ATP-binding protein EcfA2
MMLFTSYFSWNSEFGNEDEKEMEKENAFRLPITYVDPSHVFPLSNIVASDLELCRNASRPSMYEHMLQPKNEFTVRILPEWQKIYTTDIPFLEDSQCVISDMESYMTAMRSDKYGDFSVECDNMLRIWNDTQKDADFMDKYSYIQWDMIEPLNRSPLFLQALSIVNMTSPLLSLIMPILFFIFPFCILKIQGIPITFDIYIETLKELARNHFIGKTIGFIQTMNWDKIIYLCFTVGFYFLQMYQNIISCTRFYATIKRVNTQLLDLRKYLGYSIKSMENFVILHKDKKTYCDFCKDITYRISVLQKMYGDLEDITPFIKDISTIFNIGYMFKCYYELHVDTEYSSSLYFSFGFEGYIGSLMGLYDNLHKRHISFATFVDPDDGVDEKEGKNEDEKEGKNEDEKEVVNTKKHRKRNVLYLHNQYYAAYKDVEHVSNDVCMDKNIIITGPNASGKTTLLKSTCLNIIFSQQFGCGFFESCSITPYTHIHSYLNIPDSSDRDSLFQAEARRCKEILDIIENKTVEGKEDGKEEGKETSSNSKSRHFCIFDELYSGSNPTDSSKSSYSFLKYLTKYSNVDFMLTTHYTSVCKKFKTSKHIRNYQMIVSEDPPLPRSNETEYTLKYSYKIRKGISNIQAAIHILIGLKYPCEIIDTMKMVKMI